MRIQLKSTIILSLTVLITAACARQNDSYIVGDNTPSPKVYSYSAASATGVSSVSSASGGQVGQTPVTHSHSGRVHTHLLPSGGLIHTHAASVMNTSVPVATAPAPIYNPRPVYRAPVTTRSYSYVPPAPRYTAPVQRYASSPAPRYTAPVQRYTPPAAPRYTAPVQRYTPPAPAYVAPRAVTPRPATPQYTYSGNYDSYSTPDYSYTGSTANSAGVGGVNDYNYSNPRNSTVDSYTGANTSYYGGAITEVDDYTSYSRPKATTSYANPNYDYTATGNASSTGTNASSSYYSDYSTINNTGESGVTTAPSSISTYSGGNNYTVQRGDTVFQVMRNTGVYWKDIIRLNRLKSPAYTIKPGQVLRLK